MPNTAATPCRFPLPEGSAHVEIPRKPRPLGRSGIHLTPPAQRTSDRSSLAAVHRNPESCPEHVCSRMVSPVPPRIPPLNCEQIAGTPSQNPWESTRQTRISATPPDPATALPTAATLLQPYKSIRPTRTRLGSYRAAVRSHPRIESKFSTLCLSSLAPIPTYSARAGFDYSPTLLESSST